MTTGSNMATITASLQNCSLSNHHRGGTSNSMGIAQPDGDGFSDSSENHTFNTTTATTTTTNPSDDATLELNSEISLPYHWEQCLDLKTGEIYYINWRTGMRVNEDPRTNIGEEEVYGDDNLYYSEEDDDNSYDSEGSSSAEESSFSSSRVQMPQINIITAESTRSAAAVLVLGGCKTCLMYFMVPKEVDDCPRCGGQLLHFDQN